MPKEKCSRVKEGRSGRVGWVTSLNREAEVDLKEEAPCRQ